MKRWGIVLAVAAILVVVGGALYVATRSPSNDATSPGLSVDTAAPALAPGSAGRLTAWVFGGEIPTAVWERIAGEFQKSSGYLVQLTAFDSEEKYREALRLAMADHKLPDVFLIEASEAEALQQGGQIAPIDVDPADATAWVPGAMAAFRHADKTLGFPSEFNVLALYYNQSSFDRVGVAYPDIHWTWQTLLGISQAIYLPAQGERKEPLYSIELPLRFDLWQAFACQAGGGLYEGATWQVGQPKFVAAQVKALTFLRDFILHYVISPRPPSPVSGRLFLDGKASMAIAGTELLRDLRSRPTLRWGVAPLPKDEARATVLRARGWTVAATCPHVPDAARLARSFASQPSRASWLSAKVVPGSTYSAVEQVFYDSATYASPPPAMATAPELERIINEELLRWIGQNNPSPAAMIDWTQKLIK